MFDILNSFGKESFDLTSDKPFHNAIFANGIFQVRKAAIGTFTVQVEKTDFTKYGLTQKCEEKFEFDHTEIPKIPVGILLEVIKLYREVSKTIKSEVYCAIVWDRIKKDFFIHVPVQTVAAASITYTNTTEIYDNPDLDIVMDIHSHVNMNAFFSGTDLKDEMGTRFYGVIGKVDSDPPEMVCRASTNGHSISLDFDQIFDVETMKLNDDSDYSVPESDYANISEHKYNTNVIGFTGNSWNKNYYAGDWDYDDFYQPSTGKTTNKTSNTTRTTTSKAGEVNPYTAIYTQLNTVRYSKNFNIHTVLNFLSTSVECAARYLEETDAPIAEIESLLQQVDSVMTSRFYSLIDQLDYAVHQETEFSTSTTQGELDNDNSGTNSTNI